jgi:hypothetical protein
MTLGGVRLYRINIGDIGDEKGSVRKLIHEIFRLTDARRSRD